MSGELIGSLCTGYGGLDMAARAVFGGRLAWWSDIEPGPIAVMNRHAPGVPNIGDLSTVDWTTVPRVDILTAGYPCQPFSNAGKRLGTQDPRHIWPHIARGIGVLRPRFVVLENVAGHVRRGLGVVIGDLAALGYDAVWTVVRASDVGAPHRRERLFILATDTRRAGLEGAQPARGHDVSSGCSSPDAPRELPHGPGNVGTNGGLEHPDRRVSAADATGVGRDERGAESTGVAGRPDVAIGGPSASADSVCGGCGWNEGGPGGREVERVAPDRDRPSRLERWGEYAPAVERWERRLGREASEPTVIGARGAKVLSPFLVEWMMGLDAGHVTATAGLSRNQMLRLLGNGVVPQQAEHALRILARLAE